MASIEADLDRVVSVFSNDTSVFDGDQKITNYKILSVHKRRLSLVYQLKIFISDGSRKHLFVKLPKFAHHDREKVGAKLQIEFNLHFGAYERFKHSKNFVVVKPVAVYPEIPALFTESFVRSVPIKKPIFSYLLFGGKKRKEHTIHLLKSVGEVLREFHSVNLGAIDEFESVSDDLREYIQLRLSLIKELIDKNYSHVSFTVGSLFEQFCERQASAKNLSSAVAGGVHGDFTPGNVLFDGRKLALIDFSEATTAPFGVDTGCFSNFLNMLPLNKPVFSKKRVDELNRAFLGGYGSMNDVVLGFHNLYQFRYLTTNLLTQLREADCSRIKRLVMRRRIVRYVIEMETLLIQ